MNGQAYNPQPRLESGESPRQRANSTITATSDLITYIIPDFNAVKHFQRDFVSSNEFYLIEESISSGFDIYLVEQWVYNRKVGTVVSTFTGNSLSKVAVIKFTIIKKPSKFYPLRFQEYLNEVMLNHGKIKKMDYPKSTEDLNDFLFVTNLTALPPNLNLIPISQGDSRVIQDSFTLNSNLKKLNCSGRSLSLINDKISDANEDKFRHMYKIYNSGVPIRFAVKEIVNIIQISLFYFDLLDAKYCDGLLCNKTEEAILNWWNLIGLPHFNFKPNSKNGILPSRTVAAIISLILSIRLRLQIIGGCDVPKDPYDFENFMISIGQFQKQFKLEKRRKLDLETLNRLFSITNSKLLPDKYNPSSMISLNQLNTSTNNNNLSGTNLHNNFDYEIDNSISLNTSIPSTKRNKIYYGKELKKLTNVVKNSVQDRINVRDNESYFFDENSNGKSSGVRFRNRIAKLADNLSPLDVETLELEVLVKNYLTGKTLFRLWIGYNNVGTINEGEASTETNHDLHHSHHNHHHHHRHHHEHNNGSNGQNHLKNSQHLRQNLLAEKMNQKHYNFVSLKDAITKNQSLALSNNSSSFTDLSRYSRGLNRVKLGLQGRRNFLSTQQGKKNGHPISLDSSSSNRTYADNGISSDNGATLDSLLQIPMEKLSINSSNNGVETTSNHATDENVHLEYNDLEKFNCNLNRRNSFPFLMEKHEGNLNVIEFLRSEQFNKSNNRENHVCADPKSLKESYEEHFLKVDEFSEFNYIKRRSSFSNLEEYFYLQNFKSNSINTFSNKYLKTIDLMIKFDFLKEFLNKESENNGNERKDHSKPYNHNNQQDAFNELSIVSNDDTINKKYQQLNLELIRLQNNQNHMLHNKGTLIDENFSNILDYKIKDLTVTIDRVLYETRIVVQRINELEENARLLNLKLHDQCMKKLTAMIDNLVYLSKFKKVFSFEERNNLIFKLTGKTEPELYFSSEDNCVSINQANQNKSVFRIIVIFLYEMIDFIFQLFKFDRSKMNLDRIRSTWKMLDPNRKYINRAYSYLGREPSRPPTSEEMVERTDSVPE